MPTSSKPRTKAAKTAARKNTTKSPAKASVKSPEIRKKAGTSKPASRGLSRAAKSGSMPSRGCDVAEVTNRVAAGKVSAKPKGKRRQPKVSKELHDGQRRLIDAAAAHAIRIGKPFNHFVTINWQQAGVADPYTALTIFRRLARDWQGEDFACIWVMECGPSVGLHSHMLLSVPPHRVRGYNKLCRGWLKKAGLVKLRKDAVKTRRIGHSNAAAWSTGKSFEAYHRASPCAYSISTLCARQQVNIASGVT